MPLQLPLQPLLLLCKKWTPSVSQNMTGMFTDSPNKPSMTHSSQEDKMMVHIPTTDMLPENGPLPRETNTISQTRTLMRKSMDSLEPTKTSSQLHMPEEKELIQSTDGITSQQALSPTSAKEPPRILVTLTLMRKSSDSSEPIRT